jgi:hypothetical protein
MHMDIFNDDAFSVVSLTKAIEDMPSVPGRIGQLGLFTEEAISTTSVSIEKQGNALTLVGSAPRGSAGQTAAREKRQMLTLNCIHLPQYDSVNADEIQNVRAFGSETDVETIQRVTNKRLTRMRRDLDVTLEFQRMGAIKGIVLDSDGTTVLENLHTRFGTTPATKNMILGTAGTNIKQKVVEAKRQMRDALGGLSISGYRAMCSTTFFDALVAHAKVEAAYDRWMNGEFLRSDQTELGFYFAGVFWEEYDGSVGAQEFIAPGTAQMIPEGVPDLFVTHFAPADYMETVNTMGQAYYAKQWAKDGNKGIHIESQSNPIHICTRPQVPITLLAA